MRENYLVSEAKILQKEYKKSNPTAAKLEKIGNERMSMSTYIKSWKDWVREGQFWLFGIVYMTSRVSTGTLLQMQPFYLKNVLGFIDLEFPKKTQY
jgi:hypothetical protein